MTYLYVFFGDDVADFFASEPSNCEAPDCKVCHFRAMMMISFEFSLVGLTGSLSWQPQIILPRHCPEPTEVDCLFKDRIKS